MKRVATIAIFSTIDQWVESNEKNAGSTIKKSQQ
jgi:hypothetical protein